MMKTKVFLIAAALGLSLFVTPAHATGAKTLVIIDSGVNMQLDWVKNAVIEEACFIEYGKCPNGLASMTGPGAAHLDPALVKDRALSHGTQMASVALATNPNVKIVVVRIVGMSARGFANSYTTRGLATAMDWVTANATRLNVGAVSIALGRTYSEASCPVAAEPRLQSQIVGLASMNVATVVATGNNSNKLKVNYPACIPEAIAVGATDRPYTVKQIQGTVYPIMLISNGGPDLDIVAMGRYPVTDLNGITTVSLGTSNATTAVATRLAQSLSDGSSLASVMEKVNGSLQNAYRTVTDFVKKYW
jgi:hypothetical protein